MKRGRSEQLRIAPPERLKRVARKSRSTLSATVARFLSV
jgi:hypothetical protein